MKKIFLSIQVISLILLSACSESKKVKSIVDFTAKINASENITESVTLSAPTNAVNFTDPANFVNNNQRPIELDEVNSKKFKSYKVAKSKIIANPVVENSFVYSLDQSGTVTCFDLKSRKTIWQADLNTKHKNIVAGTIVYNNGKIYITIDRELVVLIAENGKEEVRKILPDLIKNQPVVQSNGFILQTVSNQLIAYNTDNWNVAWVDETWPETLASLKRVSPILYGQTVISSFSSGQMAFNNLLNGETIWQINLSANSASQDIIPIGVSCQPIVHKSNLFVAASNEKLVNVSLESSKILWNIKINDVLSMSASGNSLFLTTNGRQIVAVSQDSGKILWTTSLINNNDKKSVSKQSYFFTPIVTENNLLVISTEGVLYLVDPITGKINHQKTIPRKIEFFAIANKKLILFEGNRAYYNQ